MKEYNKYISVIDSNYANKPRTNDFQNNTTMITY